MKQMGMKSFSWSGSAFHHWRSSSLPPIPSQGSSLRGPLYSSTENTSTSCTSTKLFSRRILFQGFGYASISCGPGSGSRA